MNADGVYLTAYCALHLGLRLCKEGAYSAEMETRVTSGDRQRFVDSVLGSGLLVYASPAWLAEVFDSVSEVDVLGLAAREEQGRMGGLRALLSDLEGFGETKRGSQMLSDFKRFRQDVARITINIDEDSKFSVKRKAVP